MSLKTTKRGTKSWVITRSKTSYNLNFKIFEGKEKINASRKNCFTNGETICSKEYCVYFDNFFTSFPLLNKFLQLDTFACGTVRQNKKYPKTKMCSDVQNSSKYVQNKSSKQESMIFDMSNDIAVHKWKDRGTKCVLLASSFCKINRTLLRIPRNSTLKNVNNGQYWHYGLAQKRRTYIVPKFSLVKNY